MSTKPVLVTIHGMGNHTADSFKKEVIDAANTALKRYSNTKNEKFESHVIIEPIAYDWIFEEIREQIVESSQSVLTFLQINSLLDNVPGLIPSIAEFESDLGDDDFVNTHWLDVLLYLTNLGERIRVYVARELVGIMARHPQSKIYVLAHSLGTAVLHDALSKLYRSEFDPNDEVPDLSITDNKLHGIWMIANVSRILSQFSGMQEPYKSVVRPGEGGCSIVFRNVQHELDPFTWPRTFQPKADSGWIRPSVYQNAYKGIVIDDITRFNTHDVMGYLEDPKTCYTFLNDFMDFDPSEDEWEAGNKSIKTIKNGYQKLKDKLFELDNVSDVRDFLKMISDYQKFIKELKDDI